MSTDPSPMSTWPQAFGFAAMMLVFLFALSFMIPYPWLLLAHWLDERMKLKNTLAQARLQEAKNAARRQDAKP